MSTEPKFQLQEFPAEEGKKITEEFEQFLTKHNAHLAVVPIINQNGTLGAQAHILKKVELVPKATPSPFVTNENGEESVSA
jgi:hypothetical protein